MKKVNWKRVFLFFVVYLLIAIVLRYLRDREILSKAVYFILDLVNMAVFLFSGSTKCRKEE